MNAGGVLNTCKSNGAFLDFQGFVHGMKEKLSGGRVSNAWATCLFPGDNTGKLVLIPHKVIEGHPFLTKGAIRGKRGPRLIS